MAPFSNKTVVTALAVWCTFNGVVEFFFNEQTIEMYMPGIFPGDPAGKSIMMLGVTFMGLWHLSFGMLLFAAAENLNRRVHDTIMYCNMLHVAWCGMFLAYPEKLGNIGMDDTSGFIVHLVVQFACFVCLMLTRDSARKVSTFRECDDMPVTDQIQFAQVGIFAVLMMAGPWEHASMYFTQPVGTPHYELQANFLRFYGFEFFLQFVVMRDMFHTAVPTKKQRLLLSIGFGTWLAAWAYFVFIDSSKIDAAGMVSWCGPAWMCNTLLWTVGHVNQYLNAEEPAPEKKSD